MKKIALGLIISLAFSVSCVALTAYSNCEDKANREDEVQVVGDLIDETLKNRRDELIDQYISLPEDEREAFLMEEALPLLMDEVCRIPELKESLMISQEEMDQVEEFLKIISQDENVTS